jgi:CRISPR/Cas system-associated endonuclease Cas1
MGQSTRAISVHAAHRDEPTAVGEGVTTDSRERLSATAIGQVTCRTCGRPVLGQRRRSCSAECEREYQRQYQRGFQREAHRRRMEEKRNAPEGEAVADDQLPSTRYGPNRSGVMVVSGFGIAIRVDDGHLVIATRDEGEIRLPRVSPLRRLVVIGTSGSVSLLALWWCREVGISVVVIEPSGRVLTTTGPDGRSDTRLRRGQALAPWTAASLILARDLNLRKFDGYVSVLSALLDTDAVRSAVEATQIATSRLRNAQSIVEVRSLETDAGIAYHNALSSTPVRWGAADVVPDHWRTLGVRRSRLSDNAQHATTPGQALRNFIGGLAGAEILIACRSIGLDPGLGIGLHDDVRGRQSLVWEVMEAVRPVLDGLTLRILGTRAWRRGDFHELSSGEVRLRPDWPALRSDSIARARSLVAEVTRLLADELRRTQEVAEVVEQVATVIAKYAPDPPGSRKTTRVHVPTILTESRRIAARHDEHGLPAKPSAGTRGRSPGARPTRLIDDL